MVLCYLQEVLIDLPLALFLGFSASETTVDVTELLWEVLRFMAEYQLTQLVGEQPQRHFFQLAN